MLKQRPGWRRQLYVVIPAVTAILQTYGLLTEEQASVWASLAVSLLGLWLAWSHPLKATAGPAPEAEVDAASVPPVVEVVPPLPTAGSPRPKVTVKFHPQGVMSESSADESAEEPVSET
ncbi:MAG: hypothetical protein Q3991_00295 [Rothia sp. (in: high G+C Gram-positive bacteria)]|uniref:phage holin n=1 Tax=Rothia sp. (in: high G+C Gram-positive bacteria) TaxID=1885016 RepID=UPI0026DD1CBD|nr:hypothetical protein [Rothia sp. (in: high G+C Gram-positive bacteria)]MDO4883366.1 hypothetical protein [Rothia sp. (in: high G+C Gram-positive bacteria)]